MNSLESNFSLFQTSLSALAKRQEVLASNIANNDTPNFKSKDFDYRRVIESALSLGDGSQSETRLKPEDFNLHVFNRNQMPGVDGNDVNLDTERAELATNALKYESMVTFTQIDIKNLLSVLQG